MYSNNTNKLIELIYESAIDPSKWTELLNALAEFVEHMENKPDSLGSEQNLLSVMPNLDGTNNKDSNTSISETLKSITDINVKESLPEINQTNDLLTGHFARALKIAKRLVDIDEQHNIVLSLLDRMPIALVLVNSDAKIIETNTLADELLTSGTGLNIKSNKLDVGLENNERLLTAIKSMSKHDSAITQGQSLSISNDSSKNNIMFFIAPLRQQDHQHSASVAIFISQRKSHPVSIPKEFSEIYSLTNKELEITQQLVRGLSIKEISDETSVSAHTVRSQVKSVMHKTATCRQAELVSLVYNSMGDFVNTIRENEPGKRSGLLNKSKKSLRNYTVFQLNDGRNIAYAEYGSPKGEPVFHCHSVLGSRLELPLDADEISKNKNVRLIIMDRPGFGASDPDAKSCFIKWVDDLSQLADHLNLKTFSLTGYAMGGIYALACAHEMPDRIKKIAIIACGVPPTSSSDFKDIIPLYKMNNRLAKYLPQVYRLLCPVLVKGILSDPYSFFNQFKEYIKASDRELMLSDDFKTLLFEALKEAFRQGGKASANEIIELMHKWSFDLKNITTAVDVWHGEDDYHIPVPLGKRMSKHIKNTNMFIKKEQGHYMFYTHWGEILDNLLKKG